jgi:hypothetical protein
VTAKACKIVAGIGKSGGSATILQPVEATRQRPGPTLNAEPIGRYGEPTPTQLNMISIRSAMIATENKSVITGNNTSERKE